MWRFAGTIGGSAVEGVVAPGNAEVQLSGMPNVATRVTRRAMLGRAMLAWHGDHFIALR